MFKKITILFLWTGLTFFAASAFAGRVELTTYYPAPTGEYNTVKYTPTTPAPFLCTAGVKGTVYYDSDPAIAGLYVCDGTQWTSVGGQNPAHTGELVTFTKNGDQTVTDTLCVSNNCWKGENITNWNHSPAVTYPGCGITPENIEIQELFDNKSGVLQVDLRCFKNGFYLIEWDGSVAVDGAADKWAAVTLKYAYQPKIGSFSGWKALAPNVGNRDFEDVASPGVDSSNWLLPLKYSTHLLVEDTRLAFDLATIPDDAQYLYLYLSAKNVDNPNVGDHMSGAGGLQIRSRVNGGFFITVTRVK